MKTLSILFALVVIACTCSAETSLTTSVWSKYVSNSSVYHDKAVIQTVLATDFTENVSGSVFYSMDPKNPSSKTSFGNEIDYKVSFAKTRGSWSFGGDLAYWDVVEIFKTTPADVVVGTAWLSRSFTERTSATLTLERLVSTDREVFEGGTFVTFEVGTSLPLGKAATLELAPAVIYDDGAFGSEPAWMTQISAALVWKVGKFTLSLPKYERWDVISKVDDRPSTDRWGASLSVAF